MQNHPWDSDESTQPYRRDDDDDVHRTPSDDELDAIPPPLRNWQVVTSRPAEGIEIDGEATVIDDAADDEDDAPVSPSQNVVDSTVVAGLAAARVTVIPGETATLTVNLFNNGRWPSLFEVMLEGWIDERWCPDLPTRVHLEPGARQTITIALTPPLSPTAAAGEHAAVLIVRAPRYPGRVTRLGVTLEIAPRVDIQLGALTPRRSRTTWFRRTALVHVPVVNRGNIATAVQLAARDRDHACEFFFFTDTLDGLASDGFPTDDFMVEGGAAAPGRTQVTLAPGEATSVAVEIRPHIRPIFGLMSPARPFRLTARPLTPTAAPDDAQMVVGWLNVVPLIGLWHLVIVAVLGVVALFGMGLTGLALLMALRSAPAEVAPTPVPAAAPAAPVVAFVIQLGEPAPTGVPPAMTMATPAPAPLVVTTPSRAGDTGVPVVSADQVSAPGEPVPTGQPQLQPVAPDSGRRGVLLVAAAHLCGNVPGGRVAL